MYIVEPEVILGNILQTRPRITIALLKEVDENINRNIAGTCADISRNSLGSAIEYYPHMFMWWEDYIIERVPFSEEYFEQQYINMYINCNIPPQIKEALLKILQLYK